MPDQERFIPDNTGLRDYFELWRHFEAAGDAGKERMVTVVSLLLGFATVILAYIVTNSFVFDRPGGGLVCAGKPGQAVVFGAAGLLICLYTAYLVLEFGDHARRNWARAGDLQRAMPVLRELFKDRNAVTREDFGNLNLVRRQVARTAAMTQGFKSYLAIVAFTALLFVGVLVFALFGARCPPA
jgi:hypothetical protein